MNLNENYTKLDPSGLEKALVLFPEQIMNAFVQASEYELNISDFDSIVVSGMGGSSNAGKIVQGILETFYNKPFNIWNDYNLPSWVNKKTLVIANSYSGNTEETISGFKKAKEIGAQTICISTGGELNQVVVDPKDTNPTGFPKSGLGISLGALLGVLSKIGVYKISVDELKASLDEVKKIRDSWDAKETATWLNGYIPVLMTGRPLLGSLNAGRNAMCEISRNFTEHYGFPEIDHVLVEAVGKPRFAKYKKYLFFDSEFNNERVRLRYKITDEIYKEQGLSTRTHNLKGQSVLTQSLELAHYCAWVGFYLSILQDADPTPEPWIIKLKNSLTKS